jgi:hypothetical protein
LNKMFFLNRYFARYEVSRSTILRKKQIELAENTYF